MKNRVVSLKRFFSGLAIFIFIVCINCPALFASDMIVELVLHDGSKEIINGSVVNFGNPIYAKINIRASDDGKFINKSFISKDFIRELSIRRDQKAINVHKYLLPKPIIDFRKYPDAPPLAVVETNGEFSQVLECEWFTKHYYDSYDEKEQPNWMILFRLCQPGRTFPTRLNTRERSLTKRYKPWSSSGTIFLCAMGFH